MIFKSIQFDFRHLYNGKESMRYAIFDVLVIISAAAAMISQSSLHHSHLFFTSSSASQNEEFTIPSVSTTQQYGVPEFQIDDKVEVYDPTIIQSYAFPAVVRNVTTVDNHDGTGQSFSYVVQPGFNGSSRTLMKIPPSGVRAVTSYKPNDVTTCVFSNRGKFSDEIRHYEPCTIRSHVMGANPGNGGWYSVSYRDGMGNMVDSMLPMSRIFRFVEDASDFYENRESTEGGQCQLNDDNTSTTCKNLNPSSPDSIKNFIKTGKLVEFYSPDSHFAYPAKIVSATPYQGGTTKYVLSHEIRNITFELNDVSQIHPYNVYPDETHAFCNVGSEKKLNMIKCQVLSHYRKENGDLFYRIALLNENIGCKKKLCLVEMSYSRLQRIIDNVNK